MDCNINCPIEGLLKTRFWHYQFEEKKQIIRNGRPMPEMPDLSTKSNTKSKSFLRRFNHSQYEKTKWLAGSVKLNKVYCWPCLLFSSRLNIWNDKGYSDLSNMYTAIIKHERSQRHIGSCLDMNIFEDLITIRKLSREKKLRIQQYNDRVSRNINILKRLIDIVIYLASEELSFINSNASAESHKHEHRSSLINLLYHYDEKLNQYPSTTVISSLSNRIQNNLIDAIGTVVFSKIYAEIENSNFVSIILDETSDFTTVSQLSTIVRYVANDTVLERFVGFADIRKDRSTTDLYDHVCKVIKSLNCENKLICQTYGSAATMVSHLNGLQEKVRDRYPSAIYFNCCAYVLNLVLSQACASIESCSIFFSTLKSLQLFFINSGKRTSAFEDMVKKHLPRASPAHWNCLYQLVNGTRMNSINLKSLFVDIIDQPVDWDDVTVDAALGFKYKICNLDFIFLLEVFDRIFFHTDALDAILQSKQIDVMCCIQEVDKTLSILEEEKSKDFNFYKIYRLIDIQCDKEGPLETFNEDIFTLYKSLYHKIYDTVIEHLQIRFRYLSEIQFVELLNSSKFEQYSKTFPQNALCNLKNVYEDYFDIVRLQNELEVIYSRGDISNLSVTEIMNYMAKVQLTEYLSELYKLCSLIVTIPTSTTSVERPFVTLKGIKLLQNDKTEKRISNLALMSIESELLASMQNSEEFYNDVINELRTKEGKMELVYK